MTPSMREGLRRKLAFLASGTTGFAIYLVLSLLLVRLPRVEPGLAAFLATLSAVPPTFLLQKHFAFRDRGAGLPSFLGYCLLQLFNAAAVGLLARLGQQAGLPDALNFFASGSVVVVVSYLVLSRLVFRNGPRP
jgi:putative flippase GtrA